MSLPTRFKSVLKHPVRNGLGVGQVKGSQRPQPDYADSYADLSGKMLIHDGMPLSGVLCDACKKAFRTGVYYDPDQASVLLAATTGCYLCRCVAARFSEADW